MEKKLFLLPSWRSLTKRAASGAGSGPFNQRYGSEDPDPYQHVTDPEHLLYVFRILVQLRGCSSGCLMAGVRPTSSLLTHLWVRNFCFCWILQVLPIFAYHFYFRFLFENLFVFLFVCMFCNLRCKSTFFSPFREGFALFSPLFKFSYIFASVCLGMNQYEKIKFSCEVLKISNQFLL